MHTSPLKEEITLYLCTFVCLISHICDIYCGVSQLCVADVRTEKGATAVQEFQSEFGNDSSIFQKCDVTSDNDLKGNTCTCIMVTGVNGIHYL